MLGSYRKYRFVVSSIDKKIKYNLNECAFIFRGYNVAFKDEKFIKKIDKHFRKMDAIYNFESNDKENVVTLKVELKETSKYFTIIDCNYCAYISLTEKEQTDIKREVHKCKFYNARVYHRCRKDGFLYPCQECEGRMFAKKIYKRVRKFK